MINQNKINFKFIKLFINKKMKFGNSELFCTYVCTYDYYYI